MTLRASEKDLFDLGKVCCAEDGRTLLQVDPATRSQRFTPTSMAMEPESLSRPKKKQRRTGAYDERGMHQVSS